ncbi:MAG: hypothetical protein JNM20_19035 [Rhizobiales bacterium]|nr:hypothetical protein [Hyphomicrobiales bacterium]
MLQTASFFEQWPILLSTLLSPLIAVGVTLLYQKRDQSYQRRMSVFTDLMKNRRSLLSAEYVNALNLVPVVFHKQSAIRQALGDVMALYEDNDWTIPDTDPRYTAVRGRLQQSLDRKTALLLSAMARDLRIGVGDITILQGAYLPEAWSNREKLDTEIKLGLHRILTNQGLFPILAHVVHAGEQAAQPEQNAAQGETQVSPATEKQRSPSTDRPADPT